MCPRSLVSCRNSDRRAGAACPSFDEEEDTLCMLVSTWVRFNVYFSTATLHGEWQHPGVCVSVCDQKKTAEHGDQERRDQYFPKITVHSSPGLMNRSVVSSLGGSCAATQCDIQKGPTQRFCGSESITNECGVTMKNCCIVRTLLERFLDKFEIERGFCSMQLFTFHVVRARQRF